ncbi:MAG: MFS family permease [Candidatus Azotimanducaceae bacterium]|jgi:MFS family permease
MPFATKTLLCSIGLLLVGHGIQLSLLPLYANQLGWSEGTISLTGASYFSGFMLGSMLIPKLLSKVGYIRIFLTFASLLAVVILSLGLSQDFLIWIALRFLTGLSIVAVYLAAESWLSASAKPRKRGKIFSYYALVSLLGIGIGQTLAGLSSFENLFQICAIIMLSSLIPVGLFCSEEPPLPIYTPSKISDIRELPVFVVSSIVLGAIMAGSLWSVAPLYGHERGLGIWEISLMMNAIVFGAALFQVPLGILSDKFDRRLIFRAVAFSCLTVLLIIPFTGNNTIFFVLCFIFGGFSLTQYALCVALANEQTCLSKVKVSSIILMLNGGGSVAGPLIVAGLSSYLSDALLIVCGASMFLLFVLSLVCKTPPREATILTLEQLSQTSEPQNTTSIGETDLAA